jgi:hypothetical protein
MRKVFVALAAVLLSVSMLIGSSERAEARHGRWAGAIAAGIVGGVILHHALRPRHYGYYGGYAPYYYGGYYPSYYYGYYPSYRYYYPRRVYWRHHHGIRRHHHHVRHHRVHHRRWH